MDTVSIVIPTYNRAQYLGKTIRSVWAQAVLPLEIIIVDNGSTDGTRQLVKRLQAESPVPLEYVFEPRQGANFARDTGARRARGNIVVFLDDDAIPEASWLEFYVREFNRDPDVACVQGGVTLTLECPRPAWLVPEIEGYLASTQRFGCEAGILEPPFFPVSANMAIRWDVLLSLGSFQAKAWTRVGNNLLSNDEYELGHKIRELGKLIVYQPAASVRHYIPASRIQRKFFLRRAYWQGVGDALWIAHFERPRRLHLVKTCLVHTRASLKHILACARYVLMRQEGLAFREIISLMERIGRLRKELAWLFLDIPKLLEMEHGKS